MKKTNEEILEFLGTANRWLQMNQEENKFRYAVAKVARKAERVKSRIQEDIDDLNVEHALEAEVEDEKSKAKTKKLLKNEREQFEYDKAGMNARNKAVRGLMQTESEIEPHFADPPENLKSEFRIVFEDFVIKQGTNGSEPSTT